MITTLIISASFIILIVGIVSDNRSQSRPLFLLKLSNKGILLFLMAMVGMFASITKEYMDYRANQIQIEKENKQLDVIADRANVITGQSIIFLSNYLRRSDIKNEILALFDGDIDDEPGKERPSPAVLDKLIASFQNHKWFSASNWIKIGDDMLVLPFPTKADPSKNEETVTWLGQLGYILLKSHDDSEKLLQHFGNVNHPLVRAIDELRYRSDVLLHMINMCFKEGNYQKEFVKRYKNGIPDGHIEFYRHFFLRVMRTQRLIKEIKKGKVI